MSSGKQRIIFVGALCVGLISIFTVTVHHPKPSPDAEISSDFLVQAPASGRVVNLMSIREVDGSLRSQWPEDSHIPEGIPYTVGTVSFPSHAVTANILQAVTPECEAGNLRQAACPTLVAAQAVSGNDSGAGRVFSIQACRINKKSSITISPDALPVISCGSEVEVETNND